MPVSQRCVGQRTADAPRAAAPGECRQKEQMDMLRYPQLRASLPPRLVEHGPLAWTRAHRPSQRLEFDGKLLQTHTGGQMEDGPPSLAIAGEGLPCRVHARSGDLPVCSAAA